MALSCATSSYTLLVSPDAEGMSPELSYVILCLLAGAIAQVQWVSNKAHNYTGLFQGVS